ncbi:MAG: iron ABC transporter permease [Candidatus Methanomethylophilaceae archaeon]|nr:iron ABC transporter permease [Candidatus Methanomethylophilaceae archaeon]
MSDTDEVARHISERLSREELSSRYDSSVKKKVGFSVVLIVLTVIVSLVALSMGPTPISVKEVFEILVNCFVDVFDVSENYSDLILDTRMPRVIMAIITGFSLAVAGCIMQGILRNPLVSPFTLGVSTAAAFGAGISIICGATLFGTFSVTQFEIFGQMFSGSSIVNILFAFFFGLLSMSFVLVLSRKEHVSQSTIVLTGVVVSYLFQAGLSFLKYISDDAALRDITIWTMGNLWSSSWAVIILILPIVVLCTLYLEKVTIDINALAAGKDVATNLGVDVAKVRTRSLLVCTLLTCVCLAFTGAIGFIGLMAPHICRRIIGNDNRYLLPASGIMGSLILLISDTISRTAFPSDVPVGILIYVIGGAFFIWMVLKKDWRESS